MRSPTHRTNGTPGLLDSLLERLDSSAAALIRSRIIMIQGQLAKLGGDTKPNWPVIAYNIRLMVEAWLKAAQSENLESPGKAKLLEMFTSIAVGPYEKPMGSPVRAPKAGLDGRSKKKKKKKRKASDAKDNRSGRSKRHAEKAKTKRRSAVDVARALVKKALLDAIRRHQEGTRSGADECGAPQRRELPTRSGSHATLSADRGSQGRAVGETLGLPVQLSGGVARSQDVGANDYLRTGQALESVGA